MDAQQSAGDIAGQLKRILQFPYSFPHLLCVFFSLISLLCLSLSLSLSLLPPRIYRLAGRKTIYRIAGRKLSAALREEEGLCSELD
jgi:hypothetical protein